MHLTDLSNFFWKMQRPVQHHLNAGKAAHGAVIRLYLPRLYELPLQLGRRLNEGFTVRLKEEGLTIEEYSVEEGLLRFFPRK